MRRLLLIFSLFISTLLACNSAYSLIEPRWTGDDDLRARFLVNDNAQKIALYIQLQKGWHTYWHAPGDAGLPPSFEWSEQINIKNITPQWPIPKRFDEMGFTTFGYADEVILPFTIEAIDNARPMSASLKLNMMVCKDICIPKTLELKLNTINTVSKNNGDEKILDRAYTYLPQNTSSELSIQNVQIHKDYLETAISIPPTTSVEDIEKLDMFAVFKETEQDQGIALTGKLTKSHDPDTPSRIKLQLAKTDDINDLNIYARGKTLHIVVTKNGHGIYRDIQLPSPKDTQIKRSREK